MAEELIHTEEEASKILCPQFKTGCRGSGCMWWRWEREFGGTLNAPMRVRPASGRGYCGVAGQP